MEVTLIKTKAGNGLKICVNGQWLYTSNGEMNYALTQGRGCIFREIKQTENVENKIEA